MPLKRYYPGNIFIKGGGTSGNNKHTCLHSPNLAQETAGNALVIANKPPGIFFIGKTKTPAKWLIMHTDKAGIFTHLGKLDKGDIERCKKRALFF